MQTWRTLLDICLSQTFMARANPDLEQTLMQQPLPPAEVKDGMMTLVLTNHDFIEYSTSIAVGNPLQRFQALVDLSVSASFVPSIKCKDEEWEEECDLHPLYNSSASSTYFPDGKLVEVHDGIFYTRGNTSIDSFHFGYVEIYNQTFNEADVVHSFGFPYETWYDAVLPLARTTVPETTGTNLSVPSVFQNAMEQGVLARNVVAINLPRSKDDVGTLSIGGVDEGRTEKTDTVAHLPIADNIIIPPGSPSDHVHGGWYVEAVSLRLETIPGPLYFNLSGYIAMFETAMPWSTLPSAFFDQMMETIGADEGWVFHHLPCERTQNLPDLVISLRGRDGRVHDFVMRDDEYAAREIDYHIEPEGYCSLALLSEDKQELDVPDHIRLGTWFWRKFYTVFDVDGMEISCKLYQVELFVFGVVLT